MRLISKIVSLGAILMMVLASYSYATIILDNDESSFVTRAELEAVKNNVIDNIDTYNNNLDVAIDTAIVEYLSTVDVGGAEEEIFEKIKQKLNDGSLLNNLRLIGGTNPRIEMATGKVTTSSDQINLVAGNSSTKTLSAKADGILSWNGDQFAMNDSAGVTRTIKVNDPTDNETLSGWYDVNIDGKNMAYEMFNAMFPVGTILVLKTKPTFGTWVEVTDSVGRYLWLTSGQAWGTTIAQSLPKPSISLGNGGSHSHTRGTMNITGTATTKRWGASQSSDCSGALSFGEGESAWSGADYASGTNASSKINFNAANSNAWTGASSSNGSHSHTVTVKTEGAYDTGTKVQPKTYFIKMWKRTA